MVISDAASGTVEVCVRSAEPAWGWSPGQSVCNKYMWLADRVWMPPLLVHTCVRLWPGQDWTGEIWKRFLL
jgi:hypothetical protein